MTNIIEGYLSLFGLKRKEYRITSTVSLYGDTRYFLERKKSPIFLMLDKVFGFHRDGYERVLEEGWFRSLKEAKDYLKNGPKNNTNIVWKSKQGRRRHV